MKAGMDNIIDWTKQTHEVEANTVEGASTGNPFPSLFSDKNIGNTEGLMTWLNQLAKNKGGEIHLKREFVNDKLARIDKATQITRGFFVPDSEKVDKTNADGEVVLQTLKSGKTKPIRVPNEKYANKNRPHYDNVGQFRASYQQFFPDKTVGTNVKNDYLRITG